MRETWDALQPFIDARRFAEVKAQAGDARDRRGVSWRDTSVNYWREFSGRDIPVDGGPLSAKITVDGKEIGGFNLSDAAYTIPVAAGGVADDHGGQDRRSRRARADRLAGDRACPGRRSVKVTKDDFFGPIVKNYVFNLVPDTTLRTLRVNGRPLASFKPSVLTYNAVMNAGPDAVAKVVAEASDPAATVSVEPATSVDRAGEGHRDQRRRIVGLHGQPRHARTRAATSSARSARSGRSCARTRARWRVGGGSLVITSQNGDLQGDDQHGQERRAAGRQRRLDDGVQARLLAPAGQQQRAGRDHRLQQRPELREAGVGDERRHAGRSTSCAWSSSASRTAPRPRCRSPGRRRAEDRRRRRGDLAAAEPSPAAPTRRTTRATAASTATWARRRSTSRRPRPGCVAFNRGGHLHRPRRRVRLLPHRQRRRCGPGAGSTDAEGGVGGTVPATLALTLGAPATFGRVHARAWRRTTRPRRRPT